MIHKRCHDAQEMELRLTGRESDAVNGSEVPLEVFYLYSCLVIELIQLEVLAPAHENLLVLVERGRVGRAWDTYLLQLLKPSIVNR